MASLYTDVLDSWVGLAAVSHRDVPCPAGKRMVIVSIDVAAGAGMFTPLLGLEDLLTGGTFFTAITNGVLLTSVQATIRQAFNPGGGFRINSHIGSWDGRITGWLLDLP